MPSSPVWEAGGPAAGPAGLPELGCWNGWGDFLPLNFVKRSFLAAYIIVDCGGSERVEGRGSELNSVKLSNYSLEPTPTLVRHVSFSFLRLSKLPYRVNSKTLLRYLADCREKCRLLSSFSSPFSRLKLCSGAFLLFRGGRRSFDGARLFNRIQTRTLNGLSDPYPTYLSGVRYSRPTGH